MNDTSVQSVAYAVEQLLEKEGSGHDWQHIYRVYLTATKLAAEEGADLRVVSLAALLHDVDDRKVTNDLTTETSLVNARNIMTGAGVKPRVADLVCETIKLTGFHKSIGQSVERTLEAHILSDADQLDAIGAVGIARTFVYGASKGRPMFSPDDAPMENFTKELYAANEGSTVAHFFEKLLKLRGMMFTEAGKREADKRHRRMVSFLHDFFEEVGAQPVWLDRLQPYREGAVA